MLQTGLLWFDDDTKRPLAEKVADAVARYYERVGGAPTVCQLNPASAALLAEQHQKQRQHARERKRAAGRRSSAGTGPARGVRIPQLVPDPSLPVNYFFVGRDDPDAVSCPSQTPQVEDASSVTLAPAATRASEMARRRKPARGATERAKGSPAAHEPQTTSKRAAASARVPVAPAQEIAPTEKPAEKAVGAAKRTNAKQQELKAEPARDRMQSPAVSAESVNRSRRQRSRTATPRQSAGSAARARSTPVNSGSSAIAPLRPRKTSRPMPPAMQPPLPLLADYNAPATRHPRRRAS